eukprot:COSAG05_NODE_19952_length_285_cov_0.811828_1_plen_20_part_10
MPWILVGKRAVFGAFFSLNL